LALGWKILLQQRDQRNSEKDQEAEVKSATMEKDADCTVPIKSGQAVGARGFLTSTKVTLIIFTWKACFVLGLIF
jgi:hypothetical protein